MILTNLVTECMNKIVLTFTPIFLLISLCSASEKDYASIYADGLIEKFDKELEAGNFGENYFESETYKKIQATRDFIENSNSHLHDFQTKSILEVTDSLKYNQIIESINSKSHELNFMGLLNNSLKIYPSTKSEGNLTGNTFPENTWALTFDDGPSSKRTKTVVDNLYEFGFEATFFMLTRQANRFKDTVSYVLDSNMEIALHSYTHKNLPKVSKKEMDYEIVQAKKDLEKLIPYSVEYFRLPYGSGTRNSILRQKIASQNMVHVFWNVDTLDWKDKNPSSIYKRTILQMSKTRNKSGIILFHDIHSQTVIASRMVMEYMDRENKKVCSVGNIVKYINGKDQTCL